MKKQAFYLTIEGTDGCGKTSLVTDLCNYFESKGAKVLLTKEFGSTHEKFCVAAREIALSSEYKVDEVAGQILFGSIIRQNQEKVIKPNMDQFDIILSDRGPHTNYAYGPEHGISRSFIQRFFDLIYEDAQKPTSSIFINVPVELATKRRLARNPELFKNQGVDRVEAKGTEFQERVKQNFMAIAQSNPDLKVLYSKESMTKSDVLDQAIEILKTVQQYKDLKLEL